MKLHCYDLAFIVASMSIGWHLRASWRRLNRLFYVFFSLIFLLYHLENPLYVAFIHLSMNFTYCAYNYLEIFRLRTMRQHAWLWLLSNHYNLFDWQYSMNKFKDLNKSNRSIAFALSTVVQLWNERRLFPLNFYLTEQRKYSIFSSEKISTIQH